MTPRNVWQLTRSDVRILLAELSIKGEKEEGESLQFSLDDTADHMVVYDSVSIA